MEEHKFIDGAHAGRPVRLTHVVIHPKMRKPGGTTLTKQTFDRDVIGNGGSISGKFRQTLREDYELLSGEWTLSVLQGASVLAEKKFAVKNPKEK
jgi:hypothetical protein